MLRDEGLINPTACQGHAIRKFTDDGGDTHNYGLDRLVIGDKSGDFLFHESRFL